MTDAETIADLKEQIRIMGGCSKRFEAGDFVCQCNEVIANNELEIRWLRAELARVTAERDALAAKAEEMGKCIAELAVATACEECGEPFSLARIIASETLCEGCQSEADEELPPC